MNAKQLTAAHAVVQALDDDQLHAVLSLVAHEVAHRQGVFEPQNITVSVNVPPDDEPQDDKPLIVLPGGKK